MLKLIVCILCSEHLEKKYYEQKLKHVFLTKQCLPRGKQHGGLYWRKSIGRKTDGKREIVSAPEVMQILLTKFDYVYVIWNSKETSSSDTNSTTNNI